MMVMRSHVERVLIAAGAIAGAAVLAWWLMPRPISIETAKVATATFVATVEEDGKTRVRERYAVTAPLAGQSTRVALKVGDRVSAGDTIVSILPSPAPFLDPRAQREAEERLGAAEATRERMRAMVERARAQAAQAQSDLARTRALVERAVATQKSLERDELASRIAERELRAAEFQDHAAEHEVDQARALLARYGQGDRAKEKWDVIAPVDGVVLKVLQESEAAVVPGTAIIEIGDLRDLEIVVDVLSTDALQIHPGAGVQIERWGGPGVLTAQVRRLEPQAFTKISTLGVEEQRVNVIMDLLSPPRPGQVWVTGSGWTPGSRCSASTMPPSCLREPYSGPVTIPTPLWSRMVVPSAGLSNWCAEQSASWQSRRASRPARRLSSIRATRSRMALG
jgi:HlyD family secretion protein